MMKIKKQRHKKVCHKKKTLETAQIERKVNCLRKKKIDVDSLKEGQKEFVKNNELI